MENTVSLEEFVKANSMLNGYLSGYVEHNNYKCRAVISNYGKHHYLWDTTGTSAIYDWKGELPITIEELKQLIQCKIDGIPVCTECHKVIKGKAEYYWAGCYCPDCWTKELEEERKWDYSHLD